MCKCPCSHAYTTMRRVRQRKESASSVSFNKCTHQEAHTNKPLSVSISTCIHTNKPHIRVLAPQKT